MLLWGVAVLSKKRIVVFDLETTGLSPDDDQIIQIGAVALDERLRSVESFEVKVRFDKEAASPVALEVNSYDESAWEAEAVSEREAQKQFTAFLKRHASIRKESKAGKPYYVAQLAAYNSAFDAPFLRAWYDRMDSFLPSDFHVVCVMQRVMWYFLEKNRRPPKDWKLETVLNHLGRKMTGAHDAPSDVRATASLYRALRFSGSARRGKWKPKKGEKKRSTTASAA